jgi:hypothetical protein
MNEMIAYCGLVCTNCPIYLATREKNKEIQAKMRAEIARICKELYGMNCKPEDINDCDGCLTEDGRLFFSCKDCLIRKCARDKKLENCAHCAEYACEKLQAFFISDPNAATAKKRLDEIKSKI